jgi:hypothetical protein
VSYADLDRWTAHAEPHHPPYHDEEIVLAVRAWANGTANAEQQKLCWKYLMYVTKASEEFQDLSYRPGAEGALATAFAEGARWAGMMLRKLHHPALTPRHTTPKGAPADPDKPILPGRMTRSRRKQFQQQQQKTD